MKVYGLEASYFTGKLELYLRYKGIPYEILSPVTHGKRLSKEANAVQIPVVQRVDGRWMSDTTPMIRYLEREHPDPPIYPENPLIRFCSLLIEDYADEWLWRPAMHYRWNFQDDRRLLSQSLGNELFGHLYIPNMLRRHLVTRRQRARFVDGDGIRTATAPHLEKTYRTALSMMSGLLQDRAFLLGNAPSIADFGLGGPMLRHFGNDPTPTRIMRNEAPRVYAWLGRLWNSHEEVIQSPVFDEEISEPLRNFLREIAETHLLQLRENAAAFDKRRPTFDLKIDNCEYRALPVSRYRVYCLEQLRDAFANLDTTNQNALRETFADEAAEILWSNTSFRNSDYDERQEAPFNKALRVFSRSGT